MCIIHIQDFLGRGGDFELLFCLFAKKLTKTQHKRRAIAKVGCFFFQIRFLQEMEKVVESKSLE